MVLAAVSTAEFSYHGISMAPTFRQGDVLLVELVALEQVRVGDVLALRRRDRAGAIVMLGHRVVARTSAGLITRGDHGPAADAEPVTPVDLAGRVYAARRGRRTRRVWGGAAGRLWVCGLILWRRLRRLFGGPYRALRSSGLVRRLWRPRLELVRLAAAEGQIVKYVHGRRTVACWCAETGQSWCCKPYDLFVDLPPIVTSRQNNPADGA